MITFVYNVFTRSLVVLVVAMLSVNFLPEAIFHDFPIEPKSHDPVDFDSVIPQWNTKLSAKESQPEFIQLNQILGPESVAISGDGLLYTGLADGRIVELDPRNRYKMRQVLRFSPSKNCRDNVATVANECGRFLQMRFLNNTLYAIEAGTGIYKIDTKSGTKTHVGPKLVNKNNLFNSFAFDPKEPNLVYISLSSSRWNLLQIFWSFIEQDESGQVIALDIKTGKQVVIFDKLRLANGIDVDAARDQVIFAETGKAQVNSAQLADLRAAFKSAKDGNKLMDVRKRALLPVTPGNPDNIIIQGDIAYIALPFVKLNGKELVDHLSSMPNVRKAYARFTYGIGKLLQYVCENLYHHPLLETAYREITSGHINYRLVQTDKSAVLVYNLATGSTRLLGSDTFGFVSEAIPDNKGNLYLGSFRSPFLVKVKSS